MYYYLPHPDDPHKVLSYCSSQYCPEALITDKDIAQGDDGELYFAGEEPIVPDSFSANDQAEKDRFYLSITPNYKAGIICGQDWIVPTYGVLQTWAEINVESFQVWLTKSGWPTLWLNHEHICTNDVFDMSPTFTPVDPGWQLHYSYKSPRGIKVHLTFYPYSS